MSVQDLKDSVDYWQKRCLEQDDRIRTLEEERDNFRSEYDEIQRGIRHIAKERDKAIEEVGVWSRKAGHLESDRAAILREVGDFADELALELQKDELQRVTKSDKERGLYIGKWRVKSRVITWLRAIVERGGR